MFPYLIPPSTYTPPPTVLAQVQYYGTPRRFPTPQPGPSRPQPDGTMWPPSRPPLRPWKGIPINGEPRPFGSVEAAVLEEHAITYDKNGKPKINLTYLGTIANQKCRELAGESGVGYNEGHFKILFPVRKFYNEEGGRMVGVTASCLTYVTEQSALPSTLSRFLKPLQQFNPANKLVALAEHMPK